MSAPVEVLQQYLVADDAAIKKDPLGFEASKAAKNKRWSSVLHLLAASTVLQRTIVSVYPSVRFKTFWQVLYGDKYHNDYEKSIEPKWTCHWIIHQFLKGSGNTAQTYWNRSNLYLYFNFQWFFMYTSFKIHNKDLKVYSVWKSVYVFSEKLHFSKVSLIQNNQSFNSCLENF